jgi:hypothetical protein
VFPRSLTYCQAQDMGAVDKDSQRRDSLDTALT